MIGRVRLYAKLSLANLRRHRARWLLTTVGIALGVTSFTAVVALSRSIVAAFERSIVRSAGTAQLQVSNGTAGVDAGLLDRLRAVPGVATATGVVRYSVALPGRARRLTVFGVTFDGDGAARDDHLGREVLELPDPLAFLAQMDSIALTPALLREQGWRLGSTVEVQGPKGRRTLAVRGVVHPTDALGVFGDALAIMDADAAQDAFGRLDEFHWVDVVVAPGASVDAARDAIGRAVAGRAVVDTPLGRGRRMEAMLGTLRMIITLSGVVAMLVGVFLIHHTVGTAIAQRRDDLVTLATLGAPRRHLFAHLLLEVSALGLVGTVGGIAAGLGFARLATGGFGDVVSMMYAPVPAPSVTITVPELALALALGLGAVLAGAVVPCARALGRDAGAPSRQVAPGSLAAVGAAAVGLGLVLARGAGLPFFWGRVAAVAAFAALVFAGVTLLVPFLVHVLGPPLGAVLRRVAGVLGVWTWAQIRKRPRHTAMTVGALAAGAAFALGMATLLGSYRRAFSHWFQQSFAADVFVSAGRGVSLLGGPTLDLGLAEALRRLPGVASVLPWRLIEVELAGQPILVQGMAEAFLDRWHPGTRLDHAAGEVVVSDTLAERYGLVVGDTVTLAAPLAPLTVRIRAVEPDYVIDLGNVKVGWRLFERHFGAQGANVLVLDAAPGTAGPALARAVEARVSDYDVSVLTQRELQATVAALIDRSFALTYALELLAALVTVCAMVNATSAGIFDKASEMVTLRALGMPRRRLVRFLTLEAGLVASLGAVLGVAAGTVLGSTFVLRVARAVAGFRFPVHWPAEAMLGLAAVSLAAALGTAWVGAWRWTRRRVSLEDGAPP
jgi:putative ABC transport system permease protein